LPKLAEETRFQLALLRTPGVGAVTFQHLIDQFGSASAIFQQSSGNLKTFGIQQKSLDFIAKPDWQRVDLDLEWLASPNHHLLMRNGPAYPELLKQLTDAPALLFVIGNPKVLQTPQIAIVGSRNPSPGGSKHAHGFAQQLAEQGLTITSGLALGVDAAAHRGTLSAEGTGIAVMGNGLDRVYPAKHRDLAREIAEKGALVSEFPPGTQAAAGHFPQRNRIISGLSLGCLVVEAALQSGSLITARMAMEQGREVFAMPGSIDNPMVRGCHSLIREGAKLVETVHDIFEEININPQVENRSNEINDLSKKPDVEQTQLLNLIGYDPISVNDLVEQTGQLTENVASTLLMLELQGYIKSASGGCYYRT